mgnify:FL=1
MSSNRDFDREVTFEIVEEIGVIATHSTGWKKELNLVSWNGGQAKYDIRDWDPGHSRMSRGVTLKEQEMRQIVELLRRRRPHRRDRSQEQGVMMDTPMDPAESFAAVPASSVSDGQSQAVPAANLQSRETQQPGEDPLQGSMRETEEPQEMPGSQQMPGSQEMAASRETDDDFFVPEVQNLDAATEGGCSCCG